MEHVRPMETESLNIDTEGDQKPTMVSAKASSSVTSESQIDGGSSSGREAEFQSLTSPTTSETTTIHGDGLLRLKWNGFEQNFIQSLVTLLRNEELTDVTLVSDNGEPIKAHKIILALSSPYFRKLFQENPCKHPIVVLKGMKYEDVQQVMNFIYMGQVRVRENEFDDFMETAESLRIDGINPISSNLSDAPESPPMTRNSPNFDRGVSPRRVEDPLHHVPWHTFTRSDTLGHIHEDQSAETVLGDKMFDKRSSVSSGISSGTVGSLNEMHGTSTSSSPPIMTQQRLHSTGTEAMDEVTSGTLNSAEPSSASPTPVLIEIDDEEETIRNATTRHRIFPTPHPLLDLGLHHKRNSVDEESGIPMAEDLSKSSQQNSPEDNSYEFSLTESLSFRTSTGLLITTPPFISYRNEKRSTSWPLETTPQHDIRNPKEMTNSLYVHTPSTSPRFVPFFSSTTLPRPIAQHPLQKYYHGVGSTVTPPSESFHQQRYKETRRLSHPNPITSAHDTNPQTSHRTHHQSQDAELNAVQSKHFNRNPFFSNSSAHFLAKYGMGVGSSPGPSSFTKPKTKAIRSSQVPQSARYSATQVDSMVEKVENFPGPLVPCIVCQKFVKRERLRAHIHECHLLPQEKIECPICKIGLKSKGSFRVHLWRHRRSKSTSLTSTTSSSKQHTVTASSSSSSF